MIKRLFYALTFFEGILGLVYYPAITVIAVKPYTISQTVFAGIQALGWGFVFPAGLLILCTTFFYFLRIPRADKIGGCISIVWVCSLAGLAMSHATKVEYLDSQIVWSGTCSDLQYSYEPIDDPFITGPAPLYWTKPSAKCGKQRINLYFPHNPSRKDVDNAKAIFCKISALGTANCDPKNGS